MRHPSKRLPATIHGAKDYAKSLRAEQSDLSHSKALELTAHALGYANWNIAAARLSNQSRFEPQIGDTVEGKYLKQSFKGTVIAARCMSKGSHYQVSIHFDEAVDVVSFDSFSAFRQRINILLDSEGVSANATSDGEPHMTIFETHSNIV